MEACDIVRNECILLLLHMGYEVKKSLSEYWTTNEFPATKFQVPSWLVTDSRQSSQYFISGIMNVTLMSMNQAMIHSIKSEQFMNTPPNSKKSTLPRMKSKWMMQYVAGGANYASDSTCEKSLPHGG